MSSRNRKFVRRGRGLAILALITSYALVACAPSPTERTGVVAQAAEVAVDGISVDNSTGVNIGALLTYKASDGSSTIASAFLAAKGGLQVSGTKLVYSNLTVPGGGTKYVKQDMGTSKKDGLTWRMWAIVPKESGERRVAYIDPSDPVSVCPLNQGDELETIVQSGCGACFGCSGSTDDAGPDASADAASEAGPDAESQESGGE